MFGAFQDLSFLLHVTQYEGRSIEKLIAPREAGLASSTLGGAVIEASYVRTDPPLLAHLAEAQVPWMVNRVRGEQGIQPLDLEHLETWRAVLTRVATVVAVRDR